MHWSSTRPARRAGRSSASTPSSTWCPTPSTSSRAVIRTDSTLRSVICLDLLTGAVAGQNLERVLISWRGARPYAAGMVDIDHEHMLRAVELAAGVRTATSPNPWVGCVLVTATREIAEGAPQPPGGPHAEAVALAQAAGRGLDTRGATAYVTLEPCGHHGRTPPCADALIAAGVARVVVGIEDPDPQVRGQGIARLTAAGVSVSTGVAADVITEQLAPYITHRTTGRPYVVLKLAASLDGRTAAPDGTSRWITGEPP